MQRPAGQGRQRSTGLLAAGGGLLTSLLLGWLLGERLRPGPAAALSALAGTLVGCALLTAGPALRAQAEPGEQGAPRRGPSGRERTGALGRLGIAQEAEAPPRSHHL
jgi:hypothetical protein